MYSKAGNRIISLKLFSSYIQELTSYASSCGLEFLGETQRLGLCSVLNARCTGCFRLFKMYASKNLQMNNEGYYAHNIGAVLGQMATGGGGAHLEEQLMNIDVPPLSQHTSVQLEKLIGISHIALALEF